MTAGSASPVDAIGAARAKHSFMGVTKHGLAAIMRTVKRTSTLLPDPARRGQGHQLRLGERAGGERGPARKGPAGPRHGRLPPCSSSSKDHATSPRSPPPSPRSCAPASGASWASWSSSNLFEGSKKVPAEGPAALRRGVSDQPTRASGGRRRSRCSTGSRRRCASGARGRRPGTGPSDGFVIIVAFTCSGFGRSCAKSQSFEKMRKAPH